MTTVTPLRALPGMDGAIHHDLPTVAQDIDLQSFNVLLNVTGQVDLRALFQAIAADQHLEDCVRILTYNRGATAAARDLLLCAANDLRKNPAVQRAFTLTLSGGQADQLGNDLLDADREPERCEAEDCDWLQADYDVMSGKHFCLNHMAIAQGD